MKRNAGKELARLYESVDKRVVTLEKTHADRLNCGRGCSSCCIDGITVFEIEAENIREKHGGLLSDEQPRSAGHCAFLDNEGACRIYKDRPYVCRTQGLPLRWLEVGTDRVVDFRDICGLNDSGEPLESLAAADCLTIGEFESRLAAIQKQFANGDMKRVPLRDLFAED